MNIKKKITIDKNELEKYVLLYKDDAKNISSLCKQISLTDWGQINQYTVSTIYNRIKEYSIETGFDNKAKNNIKNVSFFQLLLKAVPVQYRKDVIKFRENSTNKRLAIKLKCLDCSGYQTGEIRNCQCIDCPLYIFRPYK